MDDEIQAVSDLPIVSRRQPACPECEGTGRWDGLPCPLCTGTGVSGGAPLVLGYRGTSPREAVTISRVVVDFLLALRRLAA